MSMSDFSEWCVANLILHIQKIYRKLKTYEHMTKDESQQCYYSLSERLMTAGFVFCFQVWLVRTAVITDFDWNDTSKNLVCFKRTDTVNNSESLRKLMRILFQKNKNKCDYLNLNVEL